MSGLTAATPSSSASTNTIPATRVAPVAVDRTSYISHTYDRELTGLIKSNLKKNSKSCNEFEQTEPPPLSQSSCYHVSKNGILKIDEAYQSNQQGNQTSASKSSDQLSYHAQYQEEFCKVRERLFRMLSKVPVQIETPQAGSATTKPQTPKTVDREPLIVKYYNDKSLESILDLHFSCSLMKHSYERGMSLGSPSENFSDSIDQHCRYSKSGITSKPNDSYVSEITQGISAEMQPARYQPQYLQHQTYSDWQAASNSSGDDFQQLQTKGCVSRRVTKVAERSSKGQECAQKISLMVSAKGNEEGHGTGVRRSRRPTVACNGETTGQQHLMPSRLLNDVSRANNLPTSLPSNKHNISTPSSDSSSNSNSASIYGPPDSFGRGTNVKPMGDCVGELRLSPPASVQFIVGESQFSGANRVTSIHAEQQQAISADSSFELAMPDQFNGYHQIHPYHPSYQPVCEFGSQHQQQQQQSTRLANGDTCQQALFVAFNQLEPSHQRDQAAITFAFEDEHQVGSESRQQLVFAYEPQAPAPLPPDGRQLACQPTLGDPSYYQAASNYLQTQPQDWQLCSPPNQDLSLAQQPAQPMIDHQHQHQAQQGEAYTRERDFYLAQNSGYLVYTDCPQQHQQGQDQGHHGPQASCQLVGQQRMLNRTPAQNDPNLSPRVT